MEIYSRSESSPTHFCHILVTFSSPCTFFFFLFPSQHTSVPRHPHLQYILCLVQLQLSQLVSFITTQLTAQQCTGNTSSNNLHYHKLTMYRIKFDTVTAVSQDDTVQSGCQVPNYRRVQLPPSPTAKMEEGSKPDTFQT